MKISQQFNLDKSQHELDFIDIDPDRDLALFIDPHFLSTRIDPWSIDATRTIQSFFGHVIVLIQSHQIDQARRLVLSKSGSGRFLLDMLFWAY